MGVSFCLASGWAETSTPTPAILRTARIVNVRFMGGCLLSGPGCPPTSGATSLFLAYFLSILSPLILSPLMLPPLILPLVLSPLILPSLVLSPLMSPPLILSLSAVVDELQPTIAKPKPRHTTVPKSPSQILRMVRLLCFFHKGWTAPDRGRSTGATEAEAPCLLDAAGEERLQGGCEVDGNGLCGLRRCVHEARCRARRMAWINSSGASAGGGASSGAGNAARSS